MNSTLVIVSYYFSHILHRHQSMNICSLLAIILLHYQQSEPTTAYYQHYTLHFIATIKEDLNFCQTGNELSKSYLLIAEQIILS